MKYQEKVKKEKRRIIQLNKYQGFLISVFAALNISWVIVQILDYFFKDQIWKGLPLVGVIVLVVSIALAIIGEVIGKWKERASEKLEHETVYTDNESAEAYRKMIDKCISQVDDNSLLQLIRSEYDMKHWGKVVKYGRITGDLYWHIMRHSLRIANGEIMVNAISNMPDSNTKKNQLLIAKIKIDDIGYTKADYDIEHNADEARSVIWEGLHLAEKFEDNYLVSKAYRHLSGTYLKELRLLVPGDEHWDSKMEQCKKFYNEAITKCENIQNYHEKRRMKAFLNYVHGNIFYEEGEYLEAEKEFQKAKTEFEKISDYESSAKVYYWLGKIYESQSKRNKTKPINVYREGFKLAEDLDIKTQSLLNGYALCRLLSEQSDKDYKRYYRRVKELAQELKWTKYLEGLSKLKNPDS